MFRATGGVNTHKGALFSFSVLLAALGRYLSDGGDVFAHAAALAAELTPPQDTHGAAVAAHHQVGGARSEALAGFPTSRKAAALLQTGYQQVLDYCRMYSMNVAQVEQARLFVSGDYVALLILGQGPDDSTADEAKLAQDEAAKVDAAWQDIFGSAANHLVVK